MRLLLFLFSVVFFSATTTIVAQDTLYINKQLQLARSYFKSSDSPKVPVILHDLLKDTNQEYNTSIKVYTVLGQYYNTINVLDSALFYGNKILTNVKGSDTLKYQRYTRAHNILAIANNHKGLYQKTASWHYKGIEAADKGNDLDLYYTHVHGLANVYRIQKEYDKALTYFKQCLKQEHSVRLKYASHINIGLILSNQGDLEASNKHYQEALNLCEGTDANKCLMIVSINMASNFSKKKQYDNALIYYKKAQKIASSNHFKKRAIMASQGIGETYTKMGEYNKALYILKQTLRDAEIHKFHKSQIDSYQLLIDLYTLQKDHNSSYLTLVKKTAFTDSINQLQKNKEINTLEVKYHTLQKEKEIISLQKEQQLKNAEINKQKSLKNIVLIAFLIFLIPLIILLIVYYQKLQTQNLLNTKEKEINQQKITTLIKDQELKLIKASIEGQDKERKKISQELHDSIGGNLAAIKLQFSSLSYSDKRMDLIYSQLNETYELVRDLSHNITPEKFRNNHFVSLTKTYIENISLASNIETSIQFSPEKEINQLPQDSQYEIFMMLQELITNTIKHANASLLDLNVTIVDNIIHLVFKDDGDGFDPKLQKKGIGLSNIQHRIELLEGKYTLNSILEQGSTVIIDIPI